LTDVLYYKYEMKPNAKDPSIFEIDTVTCCPFHWPFHYKAWLQFPSKTSQVLLHQYLQKRHWILIFTLQVCCNIVTDP